MARPTHARVLRHPRHRPPRAPARRTVDTGRHRRRPRTHTRRSTPLVARTRTGTERTRLVRTLHGQANFGCWCPHDTRPNTSSHKTRSRTTRTHAPRDRHRPRRRRQPRSHRPRRKRNSPRRRHTQRHTLGTSRPHHARFSGRLRHPRHRPMHRRRHRRNRVRKKQGRQRHRLRTTRWLVRGRARRPRHHTTTTNHRRHCHQKQDHPRLAGRPDAHRRRSVPIRQRRPATNRNRRPARHLPSRLQRLTRQHGRHGLGRHPRIPASETRPHDHTQHRRNADTPPTAIKEDPHRFR